MTGALLSDGHHLLRVDDRELLAVGQGVEPAGGHHLRGGLVAAVQHHHDRPPGLETGRLVEQVGCGSAHQAGGSCPWSATPWARRRCVPCPGEQQRQHQRHGGEQAEAHACRDSGDLSQVLPARPVRPPAQTGSPPARRRRRRQRPPPPRRSAASARNRRTRSTCPTAYCGSAPPHRVTRLSTSRGTGPTAASQLAQHRGHQLVVLALQVSLVAEPTHTRPYDGRRRPSRPLPAGEGHRLGQVRPQRPARGSRCRYPGVGPSRTSVTIPTEA